jgi:RNA polymerase sigma-70 factor (ECF subfamily)
MSLEAQVEKEYEDSRKAIYSYLRRLDVSAAEAQELTQEVYLRLYQTMRKGQSIENPRAWLFRTAHNLGLKIRARARSFHLSSPDWERVTNLMENSPEHRLLEREKTMRLSAALESLSAQQRNCLYLRSEGLRYREIAEVMGIGSSTVGEFLTRAIRHLSEALNG